MGHEEREQVVLALRQQYAEGRLRPQELQQRMAMAESARTFADLDELVESLVLLGYERNDLIERRGHVAVRGGILDVFPPTEEHPVRVELFGDTVEETRFFRVEIGRAHV